MSRKFAAAAVMLLCLAAVATATTEPKVAEAGPAGLMRRLLGVNNLLPLFGLGGYGGGSSYASATAIAGSGYPGYGYSDPYYSRP